jgi:hypothetical protein
MPLVLTVTDERYHRPAVICDHCGKEIEHAREGNYQWDMNAAGDGGHAQIFFTHKRCCHAFESRRSGIQWGATELQLLPVYLENNLAIDREHAIELAVRFEQIG